MRSRAGMYAYFGPLLKRPKSAVGVVAAGQGVPGVLWDWRSSHQQAQDSSVDLIPS